MSTREELRLRAAMRYAADYDMPLDRARNDIERTIIGAGYVRDEAMRELGRAVRQAFAPVESAMRRLGTRLARTTKDAAPKDGVS